MSPEPVRRVSVLGTGIMGAPMARNLAKAGLEVRAWNRTAEKAQALAHVGVDPVGSPAEAVAGADAVLTMLAEGEAVEGAMEDALPAMGDGAVWIQTSTVGVKAAEELLGTAERRAVAFLDAPVLGTKQPAEKGELIVLASGDEEARERCAPVFDAIGAKTVWLGEAVNGSRMKVVINAWLLSLVAGLAETLALAERLGVDPRRFLDAIEDGPVWTPYAGLKGAAMIEGDFEPSFPLRLALKDAELVLEAAREGGLSPSLLATVRDLYARARDDGHAEEDLAAVFRATG